MCLEKGGCGDADDGRSQGENGPREAGTEAGDTPCPHSPQKGPAPRRP